MTPDAYRARYERYRQLVEERLRQATGTRGELDEACRYALLGGGKRIRAVLTMVSCQAAGGRVQDALDAGTAIEILHNFTLVHDDIMDNAPTRRGRPSVHVRWGVNHALLAGDVLVALAYRMLLGTEGDRLHRVAEIFTGAFREVCRGQALDLAYETRAGVTTADYFRMIEKKTGRLLTAAAEIGGVIAGGSARQVAALATYGRYVGRAFQLQDDLLDVTGKESETGKSIGGDILERKKTYLLLEALRRTRGSDRAFLRAFTAGRENRRTGRGAERALIARVAEIYQRHGILRDARLLIQANTDRAVYALRTLPQTKARAMLRSLAEELAGRSS